VYIDFEEGSSANSESAKTVIKLENIIQAGKKNLTA